MALTQEQLRNLARMGAERRIADLERECAVLQGQIDEHQTEIESIRTEFKLKINREVADDEEVDPSILTKDELRSEIQRVLSMSSGAIINSERLATAIQSHNPTRKIAKKRSPATRIAMMCAKMVSVKRRDEGWIWNPVDVEKGEAVTAR